MSYLSQFTSTFNGNTQPSLSSTDLDYAMWAKMQCKNYCFYHKENARWQGVRESQKFNSIYDSTIRAVIFLNEQENRLIAKEQTVNSNIAIPTSTTAQIYHARLQLEFKLSNRLKTLNQNWFW